MEASIMRRAFGQLAQYTPVAGLAWIVGPAVRTGADEATSRAALPGFDVSLASAGRVADRPEGAELAGECTAAPAGTASPVATATMPTTVAATEPATVAEVAAPASPAMVLREIVREVPAPSGPANVALIRAERHEHTHVVNSTTVDARQTAITTTIDQHIVAGGDVHTSVDTTTVSGDGAAGLNRVVTAPAAIDGRPAADSPTPVDDAFGTGAPAAPLDAPAGRGDASEAPAVAEPTMTLAEPAALEAAEADLDLPPAAPPFDDVSPLVHPAAGDGLDGWPDRLGSADGAAEVAVEQPLVDVDNAADAL